MGTWTIEVVYQNGAFRPLMPFFLPEGTCATVVLSQAPGPAVFGEMDETEFLWIAWAGSLGEQDGQLIPELALEHDEG